MASRLRGNDKGARMRSFVLLSDYVTQHDMFRCSIV